MESKSINLVSYCDEGIPTAAHFTLLGDTLSRGEQREEAAAAYERALALDPDDDRAKQALERLNRLDRPDSGR